MIDRAPVSRVCNIEARRGSPDCAILRSVSQHGHWAHRLFLLVSRYGRYVPLFGRSMRGGLGDSEIPGWGAAWSVRFQRGVSGADELAALVWN